MTASLTKSPTISPPLGPAARLGSQTPRIYRAPPYETTYGDEVVDFMSQIGRPLDPWQAAIVRDAFGVRPDGLWSAFELLVLVARQNGKGGVTEAIELGGLFLFREPLILHSAHQFKTSTAAFRRLQDIIDGSADLTRRVKMISRSKGDESIELTPAAGGGRLQFVARTLGSGRGLTGSKNIFDEAAWLTTGQYAAQTPTLATIPNPQIVYTSTPPDEEVGPMPEDAMLPSVRARGHAGGSRIACYEWSPPDEGFDITDRDLWYQCNPALGIRISEWFLAQQLEAFTAAGNPGKYATEHLGLWPPSADAQWQVVAEAEWLAVEDARSRPRDPVAIGIDTTFDRAFTSIAIAGQRTDGKLHGQLAEHGAGTGWVVDWVTKTVTKRRPAAVVVGANGPARSLIPALLAESIEVITPGTADVAGACGALYDAIAGKDPAGRVFRHPGQGPLTSAVAGATKRPAGDGWLWDRRAPGVDISPLYAVTLAAHGLAVRGTYRPLDNIW